MKTPIQIPVLKTIATSIILIYATTIWGQENTEQRGIPVLNGHTFVFSDNVPNPFTNSQLNMRLGFGAASNFEFPILEVEDLGILQFKGTILFVDLNFSYQQRVKDWLALYASFRVSTRVGTNFGSLLVEGINAVSGLELGWLIKVMETERSQMSINLQVNNFSANFIKPVNFIEGIVNDTTLQVSTSVPSLIGFAGLRYVHAFNDLFAINLNGELGAGESFERGKTRFIAQASAGLEVNFKKRHNLPLGIAAAYNLSSVPSIVFVDNRYAHTATLKFAYSGAKDFVFGPEISVASIPSSSQDKNLITTSVFITSRYFFN